MKLNVDFVFTQRPDRALGQHDLALVDFDVALRGRLDDVTNRDRTEQLAFLACLRGEGDIEFVDFGRAPLCVLELSLFDLLEFGAPSPRLTIFSKRMTSITYTSSSCSPDSILFLTSIQLSINANDAMTG
jgi:hypothetical protein